MRNLRIAVFEAYGPLCEWPGCSDPGTELAHLTSRGMGGSKTRDTVENVMVACWLHARITDGEGAGNHALWRRRVDPVDETLAMFDLSGYSNRMGAKIEVYRARKVGDFPSSLAWHRAEALREYLALTRPFALEDVS